MPSKEAARRSCNYERAKSGHKRTRSIVSDYEQATLIAGLLIAVSFGLMLMWAAVMW